MEFNITTDNTDDAEDLFLLAKDRLLDVNDWHKLGSTDGYYMLTDQYRQKLHRSAHMHDLIKVTGVTEQWLQIKNIVYDDFPDIAGETVTLYIHPLMDTEDGAKHVIALKRVGKVVAISSEQFSLAPDTSLLKGIIANSEYAVAS